MVEMGEAEENAPGLETYYLLISEQHKRASELLKEVTTLSAGEKPNEVLSEFENALSHIMSDVRGIENPKDRISNMKKSLDHLLRAELDSYKILWLRYRTLFRFGIRYRLLLLDAFPNKKERASFLEKTKEIEREITKKVEKARVAESSNVGHKTEETVELWKDIVKDCERHLKNYGVYIGKYLQRMDLCRRCRAFMKVLYPYLLTFFSSMFVGLLFIS